MTLPIVPQDSLMNLVTLRSGLSLLLNPSPSFLRQVVSWGSRIVYYVAVTHIMNSIANFGLRALGATTFGLTTWFADLGVSWLATHLGLSSSRGMKVAITLFKLIIVASAGALTAMLTGIPLTFTAALVLHADCMLIYNLISMVVVTAIVTSIKNVFNRDQLRNAIHQQANVVNLDNFIQRLRLRIANAQNEVEDPVLAAHLHNIGAGLLYLAQRAQEADDQVLQANQAEQEAVINAGAQLIRDELLAGATPATMDRFREADAAIFPFLTTKAIFLYSMGSKRNEDIPPRLFQAHTLRAIQQFREIHDEALIEQVAPFIIDFDQFDGVGPQEPNVRDLFNRLKNSGNEEHQGNGLLISRSYGRALEQ